MESLLLSRLSQIQMWARHGYDVPQIGICALHKEDRHYYLLVQKKKILQSEYHFHFRENIIHVVKCYLMVGVDPRVPQYELLRFLLLGMTTGCEKEREATHLALS